MQKIVDKKYVTIPISEEKCFLAQFLAQLKILSKDRPKVYIKVISK